MGNKERREKGPTAIIFISAKREREERDELHPSKERRGLPPPWSIGSVRWLPPSLPSFFTPRRRLSQKRLRPPNGPPKKERQTIRWRRRGFQTVSVQGSNIQERLALIHIIWIVRIVIDHFFNKFWVEYSGNDFFHNLIESDSGSNPFLRIFVLN